MVVMLARWLLSGDALVESGSATVDLASVDFDSPMYIHRYMHQGLNIPTVVDLLPVCTVSERSDLPMPTRHLIRHSARLTRLFSLGQVSALFDK
jgi:hypothetical protein